MRYIILALIATAIAGSYYYMNQPQMVAHKPIEKKMSFEECLETLASAEKTLQEAPELLEEKDQFRKVRFPTNVGHVTTTCDGAKNLMLVEVVERALPQTSLPQKE